MSKIDALEGTRVKAVLKHGTIERTMTGTVRIFEQVDAPGDKATKRYELVHARETKRGKGADGLDLPDQTHEAIGFLPENLVSFDPLS